MEGGERMQHENVINLAARRHTMSHPANRRPALPASPSDFEARVDARFIALEERIRELELARVRELEARTVPPQPVAAPGAVVAQPSADGERERILAALAASGWNRVAAAKAMGMSRRTFYRRLGEYGISR